MSKWLKRGLGNNSSTPTSIQQDPREHFPAPPTDMPPASAAGPFPYPAQPPSAQPPSMIGYASPSPASVAMDVDQQENQRNRTNRQYYQPPAGMNANAASSTPNREPNRVYDSSSRRSLTSRTRQVEESADGRRTSARMAAEVLRFSINISLVHSSRWQRMPSAGRVRPRHCTIRRPNRLHHHMERRRLARQRPHLPRPYSRAFRRTL
jgi:hypothetical protein